MAVVEGRNVLIVIGRGACVAKVSIVRLIATSTGEEEDTTFITLTEIQRDVIRTSTVQGQATAAT